MIFIPDDTRAFRKGIPVSWQDIHARYPDSILKPCHFVEVEVRANGKILQKIIGINTNDEKQAKTMIQRIKDKFNGK